MKKLWYVCMLLTVCLVGWNIHGKASNSEQV